MKKILLGLACLSFIACSNNSISKEQYDEKLKENEGLKKQIERLNAEIYELKHGAAQELAIAKKVIEGGYFDSAMKLSTRSFIITFSIPLTVRHNSLERGISGSLL